MSSAVSEPREDTTSVRPGNIDALTGLRFIAAFTIALGHSFAPWNIVTLIGMPLFFTLSGFIIHYIYSDTFASGWSAAVGKFAAARFSRIYPLYFILLAVAFVATPMGKTLWQAGNIWVITSYIFPCFTWFPFSLEGKLPIEWYYGISWSVSTEVFFYILYAIVIFKLSAIRTTKTCLIALVMFCILVYLFFYIVFLSRDLWEALAVQYVPSLAPRSSGFGNSFYRWLLYTSPYARAFEFIGGCLTCQLYLLMRKSTLSYNRFVIEIFAWLPGLLIAGTLIIYSPIAQHHPWLAVGNHSFQAFFISLHMNFLLAPFCYLLIFALACGQSTMSRILGWPGVVLLGEISYSTYLGHPLAQGFTQGLWLPQSPLIAVPGELAIIYVFSWMFYAAIEVPSKVGLRRFFAAQPASLIAGLVQRWGCARRSARSERKQPTPAIVDRLDEQPKLAETEAH